MSFRYAHIKKDLLMMNELAGILRKNREIRGSIDFDLDEANIILDSKGVARQVEIAERRTANKLIEEFMLLANETVAEHFYWMEVPFLYRVHERPSPEKMEALRVFLRGCGIPLKGSADSMHPKTIRSILEQAQGKPNENVINSVTLRSMQKAFYSTMCDGHFGLSLKYYSHFTSPIRRYPDLMIHRIIKAIIKYGVTQKTVKHFKGKAEEAAEQSSLMERKAIEIEREVEKMKKAEYMSYHIGEDYEGVISGVTHYGLYVELDNTVEGMIRIDDLWDDYYDYFAEKYALVGRHNNKEYKLGDRLRIRVGDVSVERREIDFIISPRQKG
jgi:ribonuclease R